VLWIGFIQWCAEHGERVHREPVLEKLEGLQNKDAALDEATGQPTVWPDAEFIVGNPPFLGEKKQRTELSDKYVIALRAAYAGQVQGTADLVCYFFEQAREKVAQGKTKRVGLIATNSISMPGNRGVLKRIKESGNIFLAWPDRPWFQDGAAVRVSIVAFDDGRERNHLMRSFSDELASPTTRKVIEKNVPVIHEDLTSGTEVTSAKQLLENAGRCFQGVKLAGNFDITGHTARSWLKLPNPDGVNNSDVLKPLLNGDDLMTRNSDTWVIDFNALSESEAKQYVVPFAHVEEHVKPERIKNRDKKRAEEWWRLARPYTAMREALKPLSRYIATSIVAKHRVFLWIPKENLASGRLAVIAAEDDFTFGVVNSRLHISWTLRSGSTHENRPVYTPSTGFETFPFPRPIQAQNETISKAATYLEQCRTHLKGKSKTLTEIYNALEECRKNPSPTHEAFTLMDAHERLDKAVFAAYGWDHPLSEDDILERLLALNLERAAAQGETVPVVMEAD
jgi:type II restriction/modification system DNA methylase subunit YeeA